CKGYKKWTAPPVLCSDGKTVAAHCGDGLVRWWDLNTGKLLRQFDLYQGDEERRRLDEVLERGPSAAFSTDGRTVAVGVEGKRGKLRRKQFVVRIWDTVRGKVLWQFEPDTQDLLP